MSFQKPQSKCSIPIEGLGRLDGLEYANGVRQFCGIPYATLSKRWTRSKLSTSWEGDHHDGTKLGNSCPNPQMDDDSDDFLVPVPPNPQFNTPGVDEKTALVMNIVIPPLTERKSPVFAYVHGGSLLYGGANLPIFDCVNLVSHSVEIGMPIVAITFNYRVGLGGFLASSVIEAELEQDGHSGCGNFGFTDQQVAFEWIQKYISYLGGDPGSVTAVGESAGGISISHQLASRLPPKFHRAICMSGLSAAIPSWTIDEHEKLFKAVCRHFDINAQDPDVLNRLRAIPEQNLADATPAIQGVPSGTGNPCLDSWFHRVNPLVPHEPPVWLNAYMLGDTYHEGIIFHLSVLNDNYSFIHSTLCEYISDQMTVTNILGLYKIFPETPQDLIPELLEHMCGDAVFRIPNYVTAKLSRFLKDRGDLFTYHFDQRSRLKNPLEGTAYHAHELLYLFLNLTNEMDEEEKGMAYDFATAWIQFAHGGKPWKSGKGQWMIWGPQSKRGIKNELEDEAVRRYKRFEEILKMGGGETWKKWALGIDAIVNKRMRV